MWPQNWWRNLCPPVLPAMTVTPNIYMSPPVWQTALGSGLYKREETAAGVGCYDFVVGEPTSVCLDSAIGFVDLAGGLTVE